MFLFSVAVLLVVNAMAFVGCGREKPTSPTDDWGALAPTIMPLGDRVDGAQEWYAQTSEQLDSLLDNYKNPVLVDGDTIRLKADTLFNLGTKRYKYYSVQDNRSIKNSLRIVGDSPKPTIKTEVQSENGPIIEFAGSGFNDRVELSNFIVNCSTVTDEEALFKMKLVQQVSIDGVDGYLREASIQALTDSLLVTDCDIDAVDTVFEVTEARDTVVPGFKFDDVILNSTNTGGAVHPILVSVTSNGANIVVRNSTITSATSGSKYYLRVLGTASVDPEVVDVLIEDNDLNSMAAWLGGAGQASKKITYSVAFTGNTLTDDCCPAFYEDSAAKVVLGEIDWLWSGDFFTQENLGEVVANPGYTTMECEGVDYLLAAFSLADDEDNAFYEYINTPVVKFGDHNQALSYYASVSWNSGLSKWNALMNVDSLSSDIDWQCTVTLCDSTGTGSKINKSFRKGGSCYGMDYLFGGGESTEEEEEEEE